MVEAVSARPSSRLRSDPVALYLLLLQDWTVCAGAVRSQDREGGAREVTLTFSDYDPPPGVDPRELARSMARAAYESSAFAAESGKTMVVFEEGDDSASVVRKFSFAAGELAAPD